MPKDGLWYAWPDLVASVLLTRKVPRIVEAFRLAPIGKAKGLKKLAFRGQVPINPRSQDFFKAVIEERARLAARTDLSDTERDRLRRSLKTLGSATSYGIFAQMDRHESDKEVALTCYGIDPTPYTCKVKHPEAPGEYCFPPLASLITSGGHLLLALLERLVTDRGGTYAMEDTDSMAIVASQRGGLVACPGGPYRTKDGREAIRALSWEQVAEIVALFEQLNPYDRTAVPDSILKIEDDNFDPKTGKQRQLWCLAISAKRYVLFLRDRNGEPELLRKGVNNGEDGWSQHGLGHLLNPSDPTSEDRSWIAQAWLGIVRRSLGLATEPLPFADRVGPWADYRQQSRGAAATGEAQRGQAVREADQAVQLHPELPRRAVRASSRRRSGALSPDRAVRDRSAQVARAAVDRSVFRQAVPDQHDARDEHAADRAREELRRRARRVRVPRRGQVRRRRAVRRAISKPWGCCSAAT